MSQPYEIGLDKRRQVEDYVRREFGALVQVPEQTLYRYTAGRTPATIPVWGDSSATRVS